jgi:hypothetical protein
MIFLIANKEKNGLELNGHCHYTYLESRGKAGNGMAGPGMAGQGTAGRGAVWQAKVR